MIGQHLCKRCKRFLNTESSMNNLKCECYPNGIPYEVYAYINPFNPPRTCNNGKGYVPKEKESN